MKLMSAETLHASAQDESCSDLGKGMLCAHIGLLLILLSICWTAYILYVNKTNLYVSHPKWLIPALLWIAWPHRRPTLRHLQELVYLYLIFLVLLAALPMYWDMSLVTHGAISLRISQTVGILLLAATGLAIHRRSQSNGCETSAELRKALFLAIAMLAAHALALVCLLQWAYGYGWKEDLFVAGRLGLCLLAFVIFGPPAKSHWFRGLTAIPLALLFWIRG